MTNLFSFQIEEFTSPSSIAYLPQWMLKKLKLEEGDEINLKNIKLPKGEFLQLQPISNWSKVSEVEQQNILEFKLREYACLTKGDIISIDHNSEKIEFIVVDTKPAEAIMISDSDVAFDILPPLEKDREITQLNQNEDIIKELKSSEYSFFQLEIEDPDSLYSITCTPLEGDASKLSSSLIRILIRIKPLKSHFNQTSISLLKKDIPRKTLHLLSNITH